MNADCQKIPLYNTVTIALLVVHYVLMFAGVAYVALHRVVVRRKLRIKVRQRLLGPANLSELLPCWQWQWVHVACALQLLSSCRAHLLQPSCRPDDLCTCAAPVAFSSYWACVSTLVGLRVSLVLTASVSHAWQPCCGCAPGSCLSFLGEWCLLFWCLQCALCQVRWQQV